MRGQTSMPIDNPMFKVIAMVVAILPLSFVTTVFAEDKAYCGPKGYEWLVPESTALSKCSFKMACKNHDFCYSRCTPTGDLYGLPTCDNEAEKKIRKKKCDADFFTDISYFNDDRPICRLYGKLYAVAVEQGGGGFFQGYRRPDAFFQDISTRPNEIKQLSDQLDRELLGETVEGETKALMLFKKDNKFEIEQLSTNEKLIKQMTKDMKQLAPMLKLQAE